MMLFDKSHNDNIVIVPPKPGTGLSHHDEFTYSNLYDCYDNYNAGLGGGNSSSVDCSKSVGTAATTTTSSTSSFSTSTLRSSNASVSFDSSVFDTAAASTKRDERSLVSMADTNEDANTTAANTAANASSSSTAITRDPRNGAFTFQVHAEYDLLLHVQKDLDKHRGRGQQLNKLSDIELSKIIMKSVDGYCLRKQWMYHIGSEKGVAIGRFLREGVESYLKRTSTNQKEVKKFVCVELGTYCGYSALVLATTLRQFIEEHQSIDNNEEQQQLEFHIYTTEVSTKLLNVAQSVFRLAKMEQFITPILVKADGPKKLSSYLKKDHGITNIDFLLLDHAKHLYLNDLHDLESSGLLKGGSYVSADNVVFNRLDAYRDHMHTLSLNGVVESRLEEMNLEYSNNLKDGMEMTVYLKDPPATN